jgi:uracil-DNA glycosylase
MKPLIVGEAPSKNEVTERPIEGRIGQRLAACAGLSFDEFLQRFDRVNLLHVRQDTAEKGFTFDWTAAREEAKRLERNFVAGQTVLLLGKRVAISFNVPDDYFVSCMRSGAILYTLPHPSGVNRWWNEVANLERMSKFMRYIVESHV